MTKRTEEREREQPWHVSLAESIERLWMTRFGYVPVVARVVIERIRRGD